MSEFSKNAFGTCVWNPAQGLELVHSESQATFPQFSVRIFRWIHADAEWLTLQYGDDVYKVKPQIFKAVPAPKFVLGEKVFVQRKKQAGNIVFMGWHFKHKHLVFLIAFDEKNHLVYILRVN
ncbi:DUF6960 family protein [Saezia sanguinis]|uniref:DUF6960 family protein n=1 Tax=Saezia sanguinis TaxID=1965230 RepID=UPI000F8D1739|nr:hypothetical protein [Saezia sanguinis]